VRMLITVIVVLGFVSRAWAEKLEVFVPYQCQSFAQEFGVPYVPRSRVQITYALFKLNRLQRSQPGVSDCREAVEQMKSAYRAHKNVGDDAIAR